MRNSPACSSKFLDKIKNVKVPPTGRHHEAFNFKAIRIVLKCKNVAFAGLKF